ncbi:MAG: S8 family serine peptidase [Gammaproteobacteria bacterium]|nr:S8 family serine peptidase [Gammaproteobacteria bacterium]
MSKIFISIFILNLLIFTNANADMPTTPSEVNNSPIEGNVNHTTYFLLKLSKPLDIPVSVDYMTSDGSAIAVQDYISASGTATISAGQTTAVIGVEIIGDLTVESDETFSLILSNPQGISFPAGVTNITKIRTIVNDDVNASQYSIGGQVSGLNGASLTLTNNSTDELTLTANGQFTFANNLEDKSVYDVAVSSVSSNTTCSVENGSGEINAANISNIAINCSSSSNTKVTISGTITATALIDIDSDLNDPNITPVTNDAFSQAQEIKNFYTINGFASYAGTSTFGVNEGNFSTTYDKFDVYKVNLQANQKITLHSVDNYGNDVLKGDLDLYLYDLDLNVVAASYSTDNEFETITVPADGSYYIAIEGYEGASKYSLKLESVSSSSSTKNSLVGDFVQNEAIIQYKTNQLSQAKVLQSNNNLILSHNQINRPVLAKFITPQYSLFTATQSTSESAFMTELKQSNQKSYDKINTLKRIKELKQNPLIESADPNYIRKINFVPNDEFYQYQWHYPAIKLPQAWDITQGTPASGQIIVAVADTGVFLNHPDLTNNLVNGYDFISSPDVAKDGDGIDANADDPGDNTTLSRSSWHGTHVAGTIAATSNNSSGLAGVSPGAKIMPLRVLGKGGGTDYDIQQSVLYAAGLSNDSNTLPAQKADIINLSLGGPGYSQSSQSVYTQAKNQGVIIIAAAGNENTSQLSYPASYDGVVSVSATDFNGARSPYSNYGSRIDIAAPGGDTSQDLNNDGYADGVLSTLVDGSTGNRQGNYSFLQGTSMASPHVAGVAALMKAVYPELTPEEFDKLLSSGKITNEAGTAGRDDIFGYGLIDALKAVQAVAELANTDTTNPTPVEQPAVITANPSSLNFALNESTKTITISNSGGQTASITSIDESISWLTISSQNIDNTTKLGTYQVTVNRQDLIDSTYSGQIKFNLSTGNVLQIQVSMITQTNQTPSGNTAKLYISLFTPEYVNVAEATYTEISPGKYSYQFTDIAPGSYYLYAGSDIDNDYYICQYAENCGSFPILNNPSLINVTNKNFENLDFYVDIITPIQSSNSASSSKDVDNFQRSGFKRLKSIDYKKIPSTIR